MNMCIPTTSKTMEPITIKVINIRDIPGCDHILDDCKSPVTFGDAAYTLVSRNRMLNWLRWTHASAELISKFEVFSEDVFFNWE